MAKTAAEKAAEKEAKRLAAEAKKAKGPEADATSVTRGPRVRAKKKGFYNNQIRDVDAVFSLNTATEKVPSWVEVLKKGSEKSAPIIEDEKPESDSASSDSVI